MSNGQLRLEFPRIKGNKRPWLQTMPEVVQAWMQVFNKVEPAQVLREEPMTMLGLQVGSNMTLWGQSALESVTKEADVDMADIGSVQINLARSTNEESTNKNPSVYSKLMGEKFGLSENEADNLENSEKADLEVETLKRKGIIVVTQGVIFGKSHRVVLDTGTGTAIAGRQFERLHPEVEWGRTKTRFVGINSNEQIKGKGVIRNVSITFPNGADFEINELYLTTEYEGEVVIGNPQLCMWGCSLRMSMANVIISGNRTPLTTGWVTGPRDEYDIPTSFQDTGTRLVMRGARYGGRLLPVNADDDTSQNS